MTTKSDKKLITIGHELNRRVHADPENSLSVSQQFYEEYVKKGETEEADFALLLHSIMTAREDSSKGYSKPVIIVGMVFGGLTILFLMVLVVASIFGHSVPKDSRGLLNLIFSLTSAFCVAVFGGDAAAKGKIPLVSDKHNPLVFSATGGVATLIIMLGLLHYLYS